MVGSMVPTTKYLGEWRSKILLSVDLTSFDNVNTSSLAIQIEFTSLQWRLQYEGHASISIKGELQVIIS